MTVLAAIGEIQRFETARHLASYSGLTPGLEQSGTKNRGKGITKEGRRELRWALVEAAQMAVKSDPLWKQRFQEMQKRMHRNQAIVAIARHLLELVWYVLTRRQPYRHFSQERIAYKYLTWAWQMDDDAAGWSDPPAIRTLLPDASGHWTRPDTHCPRSPASPQIGKRGRTPDAET